MPNGTRNKTANGLVLPEGLGDEFDDVTNWKVVDQFITEQKAGGGGSVAVNPATGRIEDAVQRGAVAEAAGLPSSWGVLTAFVGDSLTNDTPVTTWGPQEYWTHAIELSGGRIVYGGKFGQGGMGLLTPGNSGKTWAQTLADIAAASPRPQRVHLLIGTNDLGTGGRTFAELRDAYIVAVQAIEDMGIQCVVSELPPRNDMLTDAALRLKVHTFNAWVNRWARVTGRRVQRFYAACVDRAGGGGWATGLNRDSIHPNFLGARAMGTVAADATGPAYVWAPYLAADNGDVTGLLNPLMLTDARTNGSSAETAADGIPDWWGKANTMPASYTNTLISAGSEAIGNWYRQVRDTATGGPILRSAKIAASVGEIIQLGFRFKSILPSSLGSGVSMTLQQAADTTWVTAPSGGSIAAPIAQSITGQQYAMDGVFYVEAPVTLAGAGGVCLDYQTFHAGGAGGEFYLGQVTLRNLSRLGIA